jgi:hypothetical protein
VAGNASHRIQHTLVGDAALAQLRLNHALPQS